MADQPTYHLVSTADGQTIPARFAPGVHISIVANGQPSATQQLDISEAEFQSMRTKALTHVINSDTIGTIMFTPKTKNDKANT